MPLKMQELEEPQLNLTPMLDVVFNLIIFFLVGTKFDNMERQFDVQLPGVSHAQPLTAPPDEIIVNLFASGRIVVSNRDLSMAELRDELAAARSRYDEQAVLVRADNQGTVQLLAEVFAVCQEAGIRNYSLAAQIGAPGAAAGGQGGGS